MLFFTDGKRTALSAMLKVSDFFFTERYGSSSLGVNTSTPQFISSKFFKPVA